MTGSWGALARPQALMWHAAGVKPLVRLEPANRSHDAVNAKCTGASQPSICDCCSVPGHRSQQSRKPPPSPSLCERGCERGHPAQLLAAESGGQAVDIPFPLPIHRTDDDNRTGRVKTCWVVPSRSHFFRPTFFVPLFSSVPTRRRSCGELLARF